MGETMIREMTIRDYDDVIKLWQKTAGIGLSDADSRENIRRYMERNPGLSYVAEQNGAGIIGAVLCSHDGRRGYLHHLAVDACCRGQGLGRSLVERCMAKLREAGITKCHVFIFKDNETGKAFWTHNSWAVRQDLTIASRNIDSNYSP
ncbi:GNAT family N-acetyltransferase [Methylomusa anaerophila]|nr:GNAT family N-acetyltransferase [Methylomusa anaerophila]